jgi:hypothetical protein
VGLIRGEAAGDLRTLTAATGGALALLGVLLGAAGAYLALLAGYHPGPAATGMMRGSGRRLGRGRARRQDRHVGQ